MRRFPAASASADPASDWAALVEFARRCSPYYRRLYQGVPARPRALHELPVIDREDFWEAHRRAGSEVLTVPHLDGTVVESGGTTGKSKPSCYTRDEMRAITGCVSENMIAAGLRAGDRVANLLVAGYMAASYHHITHALRACTLPVVELPIASHPAPELIADFLREYQANVLIATPSILARVANHPTAHDASLPGVRLILYAGEFMYADQRALLARAFPNAQCRPFLYVASDVGVLATPVPHTDEYQAHGTHVIIEIVDPDSGRPITEPGRPGLVIATSLVRRLMPVIRYPPGDLAEWTDVEHCRLRLAGRSQNDMRLGTAKVDLNVLRSHVTEFLGDETRPMQVVLRRRDGKEEMLVRIAAQIADPATAAQILQERLLASHPLVEDDLVLELSHPIAVEWVTLDQLAVNPHSGRLLHTIDERGH